MENEKKWVRAQVWANWIIAGFTAALFLIALWQYQLYQLDQRPWLGPTVRATLFDQTGRASGIEWHYRNGGKSPARNIRFELSLKIGDSIGVGEKDPNDIRGPRVAQCEGQSALPGADGLISIPGIDLAYVTDAPREVADSFDSIMKDLRGLYFVGCMDYEEVSGKNHRTSVCEYYNATVRKFFTCSHGNDAR